MPSSPLRSHRLDAFSLIEVLCALGIVAILALLLLPMFGRMREASGAAQCVNNLRQIGVGLLTYASEHRGELIPAASLGGSPARFWFDELDRYMGTDPENLNRTAPYKWQLCPAKPVRPEERTVVGYGWNHRHFGYTRTDASYGPFSRLTQVVRPSQTIIIADSIDISDDLPLPGAHENRYLYGNNLNRLARRHSGGGNYLMLDGHVAHYRPEQVVEGGSGEARLFWQKRR